MHKDGREHGEPCISSEVDMPGFLGIDIAKHKFDAVLLVEDRERHKVFENNEVVLVCDHDIFVGLITRIDLINHIRLRA